MSLSKSSQIPRELAGTRVLIVEDEDDARELLEHILTTAGCVVSSAGSAKEALERMGDARPQVLVSDIGMPLEDGYSLMRSIRARGHAEGGDVPSIALTAYTSVADRREAFDAGFNAYLPKPVQTADLLATLRELAGSDSP